MNLDLRSLLVSWRRLTEREGAAIARNDWPDLAVLQSRKALLRQQISSRKQSAPGTQACGPTMREPSLAALLSDILTLESRNRDALRAIRQERQRKLESAAETLQRLQALRRTYAANGASRWQSYS